LRFAGIFCPPTRPLVKGSGVHQRSTLVKCSGGRAHAPESRCSSEEIEVLDAEAVEVRAARPEHPARMQRPNLGDRVIIDAMSERGVEDAPEPVLGASRRPASSCR
jgi:hypothetical protein